MGVNVLTGRGARVAAVGATVLLGATQSTSSPAAPEPADQAVVETDAIPALVKPAATLADENPQTAPASATRDLAAVSPTDSAREREPRRREGTRLAAVKPGRSLPLRAKPGGPGIGRAESRTEFGSDTVLAAVKERGPWLGVSTPERPNGKLAWIDGRSDALRLRHTDYEIEADLSKRRVELRRDGRVVRRLPVAIGRPESPTPTGRFSVTDELDGADYSAYFGCCILALSGTQPNPPPGWQGGDRLAIHATSSPETIGAAASAGCLRAGDGDMRALMKRVPLGTPVRIRK